MKDRQNNRSSLFLIELILAILFFSLASAVCVQVFVKAHFISQSAAELTMGTSYATSAAEVLSGTDGSLEAVRKYFPDVLEDNGSLCVYYDENGESCSRDKSVYSLCMQETLTGYKRNANIQFKAKDGTVIYSLDTVIRIPRTAGGN